MDNLKISIIIPVYNLENYISQTLDSCLDQDLPKNQYEIICIDDGSADNSKDILESYCEINTNMTIYTQQNAGVSSARNKGLTLARGEYIWFVDGDDIVQKNCLIELYNIASHENCDILWFKMKHFKTVIPDTVNNNNEFFICNDKEEMYDFMFSKGGGGVCSILLKRSFMLDNELFFRNDIKYSEDVLLVFESILKASVCVKTSNVYYYYRQRQGSAMHSSNHDAHINSMEKLAFAYNDLLLSENREKYKLIIENKRDFAVKAMLFSIMQKGDRTLAKEKLKFFNNVGFYPYPLKKELLEGNLTIKQTIINLISFFFPFKRYYMFCVDLFMLKQVIFRR